jgi:O-antigen/teichoic acid export membrane protein
MLVLTRDSSTAAANLIAGTATRYLVVGLNIGVGVLLMPFTVRHLGQTAYGLWMLVASMTTYFQLLDLGYGNGVVRHLIEADHRGDRDGVNRVASTFVCVYALIAVVAGCAIAVMLTVVLPRFPHLTAAQVRIAQLLLAILGARMVIGFPLTVFGAVTNARQGFVLNNLIACATVLATAAATVVVLRGGGALVTLVATTTAINVAAYLGYAWTAYHVMPELRIRPRYFSVAQWREVTSFSVYLFVINLASQIAFNIDNIVIGAYLGPVFVAVYAIALRLAEYQRRLCDQFSPLLFPVAMAFSADGDREALKRTLIEGNRVGTTLVTGAAVCLVGFSGPLIGRWMGPAFDGSVAPFVILSVAGVIVISQAASSNVLIALGAQRLVASIWMVEAVVNLALSVVLVRSLGLIGVALGTLIPLVVGHLVVMLSAACRRVGLSIGQCLIATTRPAAIAGVIAAGACVLVRAAHPPTSAALVIVEAAIVGVVYVAALAVVGFDRATRTLYRRQALACAAVVVSTIRPGSHGVSRANPDGTLGSSLSLPN